jgi:hypothetical protein
VDEPGERVQQNPITIPVDESDGVTRIGTFRIGG